MHRWAKFLLLLCVVIAPLLFYRHINRSPGREDIPSLIKHEQNKNRVSGREKGRIALIFDDLGPSLQAIKDIYSLNIPLTVAVLPDQKFSRNIAHIADRCGYAVLVHLPMEPFHDTPAFVKERKNFIRSTLTEREIRSLLRRDLNMFRAAVGANNHMGSKATEDRRIMEIVMRNIGDKNMVFIDSHTSEHSCACDIAAKMNVRCTESSGFLDAVDDQEAIRAKLALLVKKAKEEGPIIIIGHPRDNTFKVLGEELPSVRKQIDFITIKEYFGL